jgi:TonB family protein
MPLLRSIAATVFVLLVISPVKSQQAPTPPVSQPPSNSGLIRVEGVDIPPIPNAPFSAKVELELSQPRLNGSSDVHKTFNIIARDSNGRTRNEVRFWYPLDGSEPHLNYAIVYDPATHTRTFFYPSIRFARRFVVDPAAPTPVSASIAAEQIVPTIQTEDLGTKSQDGLTLRGTRETKTYVRSPDISDPPRVISTEVWYSPALQLNVSTTRTELPIGVQTVRVTDLKRGEPDSSLFAIPAGYRTNTESDPQKQPLVGGYVNPIRVKMGGQQIRNMLVEKLQPVYPADALQMRLEGTVRLHVIIGKDGTVQQIEVISGHPLLVQAALDAVRHWRYKVTLLNGEPVEVDTTVDVVFSINKKSGQPEP